MPAPLKTTTAAKNRAREMRAAGASVRAVCRALEAEHGLSETTGRRVVRALDAQVARPVVAHLPPVATSATSAPLVVCPAALAACLADLTGSSATAADYLLSVLEELEGMR